MEVIMGKRKIKKNNFFQTNFLRKKEINYFLNDNHCFKNRVKKKEFYSKTNNALNKYYWSIFRKKFQKVQPY